MKENKKMAYLAIIMSLYCVFTVVQNLFEMKTLGTEAFAFGGGGVMLSWATFMLMDICTEVYGKDDTVKVYTIAGLVNLLIVVLSQIVIAIPGVYPEQNAAFAQIFSNGPRTALASFGAFWLGNFVNMHIMVKMKNAVKDDRAKFAFFGRAVISTALGQFVDNMVFATLAFAPIGISAFEMTWRDIFTSSIFGVFSETVIESCMVPFITIPVSNKLKEAFAK